MGRAGGLHVFVAWGLGQSMAPVPPSASAVTQAIPGPPGGLPVDGVSLAHLSLSPSDVHSPARMHVIPVPVRRRRVDVTSPEAPAKVFLGCRIGPWAVGLAAPQLAFRLGPRGLGGLQRWSAPCWTRAWGEGRTVPPNSEETFGCRQTPDLGAPSAHGAAGLVPAVP